MVWILRNMFNEIYVMNSLKYEFYIVKYIYVLEMYNKMLGSIIYSI